MKFRDVETSRYSSAISGDHGSPFPWLKRGKSYCRFVWLSKLVKCVHGCDLGFGGWEHPGGWGNLQGVNAHWCLSDAPGETCPGPARIFPRPLKNFPWCGKRTNTMARARTLRTQRSPMATPRVCGPASGLSGLLKPLTGLTGLPRGLSQDSPDSPEASHRTPPRPFTGLPLRPA